MQPSLESVIDNLNINKERLELVAPSSFVDYKDEKDLSSKISLSSSNGLIQKTKKRKAEKAIYEFLALRVWNELLDVYSNCNDLNFRAPKPIGIKGLHNQTYQSLIMSFINGHKLKSLSQLKRSTPVKIKNQNEPLPLFSACAYHLGAFNRIKEEEGLYHSDYDGRHVIFSPIENVSIGVIDLENSYLDKERALKESSKIFNFFKKYVSSPKDKENIESWYKLGLNNLVVPKEGLQTKKIIEKLEGEYGIEFNMHNKRINGVRIF